MAAPTCKPRRRSREACWKGVADATTFPSGSTVPFGIDKVTKYHIDAQIYSNEPIWVMNTAKYAALSPARRTVIDTRCTTEAAIKISTPWAEFEQAGPDHIKTEPGHEVYALTAAQLAA